MLSINGSRNGSIFYDEVIYSASLSYAQFTVSQNRLWQDWDYRKHNCSTYIRGKSAIQGWFFGWCHWQVHVYTVTVNKPVIQHPTVLTMIWVHVYTCILHHSPPSLPLQPVCITAMQSPSIKRLMFTYIYGAHKCKQNIPLCHTLGNAEWKI